MSFQARADLRNDSFVVKGARSRDGFTLLTDATVYAAKTVLGQVTATGKLAPFDLITDVDGTKVPKFILRNEVDATLGDVVGVEVYEIGEFYSEDLVLRNSYDLDTTWITLGTNYDVTVRQALQMFGISFRERTDIDGFENS